MKPIFTGRITILPIIASFFYVSCSWNSLSISDFIEYVRTEANGLTSTVSRNNYSLSATYEPADYLALKELRNEKITPENFGKVREKFTDYYYFDFLIKAPEGKDILDKRDSSKSAIVFHHLSFEFSNDVFLISGNDTMPCLLHHFENTNAISPDCHFSMMFQTPDESFIARDTIWFSYQDKLFDLGTVNIPFFTDNIERIPRLKI